MADVALIGAPFAVWACGAAGLLLRAPAEAPAGEDSGARRPSRPGRPWSPYLRLPRQLLFGLTRKYLGGRAPSLFTFGVTGDLEAGKAFYDSLKLIKRLVNIGDTRTLCCHPASTTHRQMTAEEQLRAGVSPETIRLSVGIEHAQDIIEDLDQALSGASPAASRVVSR